MISGTGLGLQHLTSLDSPTLGSEHGCVQLTTTMLVPLLAHDGRIVVQAPSKSRRIRDAAVWTLSHLSEAHHITISTWAPKAAKINFDDLVLKAVQAALLPPLADLCCATGPTGF